MPAALAPITSGKHPTGQQKGKTPINKFQFPEYLFTPFGIVPPANVPVILQCLGHFSANVKAAHVNFLSMAYKPETCECLCTLTQIKH